MNIEGLVADAVAGAPRAVARLISMVEDGGDSLREVMALVAPYSGRAHVVGITGAPGAGKSTLTSGLIAAVRADGRRVAVLAIDPSSPFSGGALLGDRVRMQEHATDPDVYIRSMATRGHLGGLSATTPQAVRVLDAVGVDLTIIETVGVGQSEVDVVAAADTTIVVAAPGMGDGVQAAKAGVLEIGDVFVVNKADRDGASTTVRELRHMLSLGHRGQLQAIPWEPPVLSSIGTTGAGVDELLAAVDAHRQWLSESGDLLRRRTSRAAGEIAGIVLSRLRSDLVGAQGDDRLTALAAEVAKGVRDPYSAADEVLSAIR